MTSGGLQTIGIRLSIYGLHCEPRYMNTGIILYCEGFMLLGAKINSHKHCTERNEVKSCMCIRALWRQKSCPEGLGVLICYAIFPDSVQQGSLIFEGT